MQRIAYVVFVSLGCLVVVLLLLFVALMHFSTSRASATLASGRDITAYANGWGVNINCARDTATLDTGGHRVVIAPTQLVLDGATYFPITADVKAVTVSFRNGEFSATADGEPVYSR